MAIERGPKYKTFGGKRYERVGSEPTRSKKVIADWVQFQREVNNYNGRVVKAPSGGYEGYVRKNPKKVQAWKNYIKKHHK